MTFPENLLHTAIGASCAMLAGWVIQRRTRDAGIVDVIWAASLGVAALAAAVTGEGDPIRRLIVGFIGSLWSLRLSIYLYVDRILRADHEDGRYLMLREQWGDGAQRWFLIFFQVQAFFVLAFATPFFVAAHNTTPFGWLDAAAIAIWSAALTG